MTTRNYSAARRAALTLAALSLAGSQLWAQTPANSPKVKFATSAGDFVVEVYPDKAPKTVENFLQYVKDKHYNGTVFHRVIDNFMVQGGGFDAAYTQKPTRPPVVNEGREALAKGGDKNVTGTLAMARTGDPHSASAQFFINVKDNDFLNHTAPTPSGWGYTVFGKVVSGMDVVNRIKATPTGAGGPFPGDVPKTPILVNSATLLP